MILINGATRSNLRFVNVHVNKFPLIFLTNYDCVNHHTNDIPPVDRKLRGYQIRIGGCPEMKFICGQEKNNQRDCGPGRGLRYTDNFLQRVCSKYAHYQPTRPTIPGNDNYISRGTPRCYAILHWNVLTPRYEIEITNACVIFLLLFLRCRICFLTTRTTWLKNFNYF